MDTGFLSIVAGVAASLLSTAFSKGHWTDRQKQITVGAVSVALSYLALAFGPDKVSLNTIISSPFLAVGASQAYFVITKATGVHDVVADVIQKLPMTTKPGA